MPANLEKLKHLALGSLVDLEILTPTSSKRVKTELVGLLDDKFIILNYPNSKRLLAASDYLRDGVMVVVRALIEGSGGQVIAFRQQVMSVTSHPARLVFIHFPKHVQLFDLRSQARIPTLLPAKLKLSDERVLDGVIKDVSLTGVMFDIKSDQALENIKDMQCTVMLDSSGKNFAGEVCSVKGYSAGAKCGIKLLASEDEMRTFMREHFIDPSMLNSELDES
ncbi:flagellar brake protein [Pseudoalteromonas sp. SG45-5]|uniref:flagellar brake protein n=1 Tax=unclassified Pseudoalteromonas TaxID=194690 RepID=UPI0015F9F0A7|nr:MULTISPECIES: flagellar brake protein [unclassified Pseudoalteromonas]MBB1385549.1 flagellar brake protein [Pseudoalteromonas sp. SG45-5]MBB1393475.1 flagellar brake protein [Pseudoalteromonas sp. SG44-4]MBB1445899.1 flagellar brake protein [Pseudoalteromonas sp. SG41-6]